jgi:hypothetical protein
VRSDHYVSRLWICRQGGGGGLSAGGDGGGHPAGEGNPAGALLAINPRGSAV